MQTNLAVEYKQIWCYTRFASCSRICHFQTKIFCGGSCGAPSQILYPFRTHILENKAIRLYECTPEAKILAYAYGCRYIHLMAWAVRDSVKQDSSK